MSISDMKDMGKLGFGVAGPLASPVMTSSQTEQLIEQAISVGIRFFDTGPSYGGGRAEQRLGNVIARYQRKDLIISTKAGLTEQKKRDFSLSNISDSLFRSLDRLQTDHVDCFFLHGVSPVELTDEFLQQLDDLRSQGLFAKLGIAGRGNTLDALIADNYPFDIVMMPMGPGELDDNLPRAKAAKKVGLQVIGIEMLAHTRSPWRLSIRPADLWYMARYIRRGGSINAGQMAKVTLAQALDFAEVDLVLSSTTKKKHLQDWRDCLDELGSSS